MFARNYIIGLLALIGVLLHGPVFASDYVLLVHPPSNEGIDKQTALSLIRGERRNWQGGIDARVALPSRDSAHYEILADLLFDLSGSGMERQWFRLVFAGQVNPPIYLDSDAEVRRYVSEHPGALGVVAASESADSPGETVLVIPF